MARGRKQQEIPGTERPTHPDIDEAALEYREVRDRRMALTEQEKAAHANLLAKMKEHGQETYKFHDDDGREVSVFVEAVAKCRVRLSKPDGSEMDGGEGGDHEAEAA